MPARGGNLSYRDGLGQRIAFHDPGTSLFGGAGNTARPPRRSPRSAARKAAVADARYLAKARARPFSAPSGKTFRAMAAARLFSPPSIPSLYALTRPPNER